MLGKTYLNLKDMENGIMYLKKARDRTPITEYDKQVRSDAMTRSSLTFPNLDICRLNLKYLLYIELEEFRFKSVAVWFDGMFLSLFPKHYIVLCLDICKSIY